LIAEARAAGEAEAEGRRVRIFFMDEARFGRISLVRSCWAPPGVRPVSWAQMEREYSYAYAAVCPWQGEMVTLVLPEVNAEMMSLFLGEVSRHYPQEQVVMILDQAGWHTANRLQLPGNLTLFWLPPYSPELNPVEHLWEAIREGWFYNRKFSTLTAVEDQLVEALQYFLQASVELRSLTLFSWLN